MATAMGAVESGTHSRDVTLDEGRELVAQPPSAVFGRRRKEDTAGAAVPQSKRQSDGWVPCPSEALNRIPAAGSAIAIAIAPPFLAAGALEGCAV